MTHPITESRSTGQSSRDAEATEGQKRKGEQQNLLGRAVDPERHEADVRGAAAALKASEARYRRLFETAKDGIFILDAATGRIVDVNPFLVELLGYGREHLLGKQLWELGPFKDIAANQVAFHDLQTKEYIRYEHLPLETKAGRHIDVEFVSNAYLVNGERVIQCNVRDITERKRAERLICTLNAELEQRGQERARLCEGARHAAEAANRAKDEFLAMLGHELRNPLSTVRNGIVTARLDPARRERALELARRGTEQLKRLVELHGGRVEAHSDGRWTGAEFVVRLPAVGTPGAAAPAPPSESVGHPGTRVLMVDDNADVAEGMLMLLEVLGYRVGAVSDGPSALEAALASPPDVMLVDIGMPGMDGYEVARQVRQHDGLRRVMLIALTGYGRDEDRQRALAAGFDYHLVKPMDVDEFQRLLAPRASAAAQPTVH
jgi:PAS domain S-box-containing protein